MLLYENIYYSNLGEQIYIVPNNMRNIKFVYCKNLPEGLFFDKKMGTIHGISNKETNVECIVKYLKPTSERAYTEIVHICVQKNTTIHCSYTHLENIDDIKNESITYYLNETIDTPDAIIHKTYDNSVELPLENTIPSIPFSDIENNIKKTIDAFPLSSMKYMHVNGANTFVYNL